MPTIWMPRCLVWVLLQQIPLVLHKEPDINERGQQMVDADGRLRYRCGFRIGGGIDQDPTVSPQGYPDKVMYMYFVFAVLFTWVQVVLGDTYWY